MSNKKKSSSPKRKEKDTLCWNCYRADHWVEEDIECPWAKCGQPVDGWDAVSTPVRGTTDTTKSFCVIACPLFKPDPPRKRRLVK